MIIIIIYIFNVKNLKGIFAVQINLTLFITELIYFYQLMYCLLLYEILLIAEYICYVEFTGINL